MKTRNLIRNCLSIVLACCISGLYLILYMFHIFNQIDQIPITQRNTRWVVEEIPTIVELSVLPRIAEDTYVVEEVKSDATQTIDSWTGVKLTASRGVVLGPNGKETWYNLPMDRVISSMRNRGYSENDYPYCIREDGVKVLGDYVMIATDLDEHNKGDILETSLGLGIVCDTGDFADTTDVKIDIATNW